MNSVLNSFAGAHLFANAYHDTTYAKITLDIALSVNSRLSGYKYYNRSTEILFLITELIWSAITSNLLSKSSEKMLRNKWVDGTNFVLQIFTQIPQLSDIAFGSEL